jgi:hypothetical protein
MDELRKVYAAMQGYTSEVRDLKTKLPEIVKNAIEDKATESGQVTATFVMDRLKEAFDDATGKWDPIISKAVENATSNGAFLSVAVAAMQEEMYHTLGLFQLQSQD